MTSALRILIVACTATFAPLAAATTFVYEFSGTLTTPSGGLTAGAMVNGRFEIDTNAEAMGASGANFDTYATGLLALRISDFADGPTMDPTVYFVASGQQPALQILNQPEGIGPFTTGTLDRVQPFGSASVVSVGGSPALLPNASVTGYQLRLFFDPAALSGVDIPVTGLPLALFDDTFSELFLAVDNLTPGDPSNAVFSIQSVTAVPLPAGVWLFVTALVGLGARYRLGKVRILGA